MIWRIWLLLWVTGTVALGVALVVRRAVAPAAVIALPTLAVAALQARNITLHHQDGTTTAVGSEPLQFVTLLLAVIAFLTLVASVWWDTFPHDTGVPTNAN